MNIGIFGGTFDPPHVGHLMLVEQVRSQLNLDEVWFIPSNEPPHKHAARASVEERLQMVERAIKNNPSFRLNTIEVKREGKSYTIDTIKSLKAAFPNDQFFFIIGADEVAYLPKWHRIDELAKLIQFVGVKRSGYSLETSYPVSIVNILGVDISSSAIRDRIANGQSVKYLVPDAVEDFIKERNIYGYRNSQVDRKPPADE